MGISNLEAMACGLVVISSGTGGSAELFVDGESGLRFKSEDILDLADKLVMIFGNPDRFRKIGSQALDKCNQNFQFFRTLESLKANLL